MLSATDFPPRSESDLLLLVERAEDLLTSFGAPSRSLSVNFCPPPSECTEGGREVDPRREDVLSLDLVFETGVAVGVLLTSSLDLVAALRGIAGACDARCSALSETTFPPDLPKEKLAARLGGCVDGRLHASLSDSEGEPLVGGVIEPVVEEEVCWWGTPLSDMSVSCCSASSSLRVCPGDLGYSWNSGGGRGT